MELADILRCPKTGNRLLFDETASLVPVEHSETTYPIVDGIVDFCPGPSDRIATAYDKIAWRYDPYITAATVPMKLLSRIVWGPGDEREPLERMLSCLPSRFDGVLLDVPVGTGVFTASLYRRYPEATIVGVDCSMNMLRQAQARFREQGVNNVHLLKADAANLPVRDGMVDMVLCMNGWHAFADKHRMTAEMKRVLRREGTLIACGYIRGARWLSDWFVRHFGVRNGYFTPPFFTPDEIARQFEGFTIARQGNDKSIAWFEAAKL